LLTSVFNFGPITGQHLDLAVSINRNLGRIQEAGKRAKTKMMLFLKSCEFGPPESILHLHLVYSVIDFTDGNIMLI
jgi:hypothetical protein